MMILNRIKLAVDRTIAAFSVVVMIALVFCVVWQVFSRYVLNQPSTLTDELARFLMIWEACYFFKGTVLPDSSAFISAAIN